MRIKKYISLLLSLLMVFSSITLPASAEDVMWEETFDEDEVINQGTVTPGWLSFTYYNLPEGLSNASNGDSIYVKDGKLVFDAKNIARNNDTLLSIQLTHQFPSQFVYEFDISFDVIDYGYNGLIGSLYSREDNFAQAVRFSMKEGKLKFGDSAPWYEVEEETTYRIKMDVDVSKNIYDLYINDEIKGKGLKFDVTVKKLDRIQVWISSPSTEPMKIMYDNMKAVAAEGSEGIKYEGTLDNWAPTIHQQVEEKIKDAVAMKVNVPYAFVRNEKKFIDEQNHSLMPLIRNDRTFLPTRFISESFGALVNWEQSTKTVSVETADKLISFKVGENQMMIGDEPVTLDAPVFIEHDRVFLPARALCEAIGKKVFWDERGLIVIGSDENIFADDMSDYHLQHLNYYFARGIDLDTVGKGAEIYVSPNGNDNGDGSFANPYKTLAKAQQRARELKNTPNGVTVYLRGGTYRLRDTWKFDENDVATKNSPIIYRAYGNEEPIVTAATEIPLSDFKSVTNPDIVSRLAPGCEDKVKVIDLTKYGMHEFPEITTEVIGNSTNVFGLLDVYIDGVRGTVARWPNYGYFKSGEIIDPGMNADDGIQSGFSFRFNDARPARWGKADNLLIFGIPVYEYATGTFPAKVDVNERTISTDVPYRWHILSDKPYYAYNLLEEIDVQGEYFVDTKTKELYVMPTDGMQKVEMAVSNFPLVALDGSKEIYFKDITFSGAASNGFELDNTDGIMLLGCDIKNMGDGAISLGDYAYNTGIEGCDIHDIAYTGVTLNGGSVKELTYGNNYIENCNIYRCGANDLYSPGVTIWGMGNRVSNSAIHDMPNAAIKEFNNDAMIEYNDIYNVLKTAKDMAAVYRTGASANSRGQTIRHNKIHYLNANPEITHASGGNVKMPVAGIYIDMSAANDVIYGNVFYDFTPDDTSITPAINLNGGRDFDVCNNVIIGETASLGVYNVGSTNTEGGMHRDRAIEAGYDYREEPYKSYYAEAGALTHEDLVLNRAYNNVFKNNAYVQARNINYGIYKSIYEMKNNIMFKNDPGFVDMANGDFNLNPDAELYKKIPDFKNLQSDMVGTYEGIYRDHEMEIGNFMPKFPANNSNDVQLTGNMFSWTYAPNADKYQLIVSDNENFTNILIDEEIKGHRALQSFAYWENLEALSYGENTYYWKVIAKSENSKIEEKQIGPFKFTTAKSETIITDDMDNMIAYGNSLLDAAQEGTDIGMYLEGSKATLSAAISTAKNFYGKDMLQTEFDEKTAVLIEAVHKFEDSKIVPQPKVTPISELFADQKGWWDTGRVEKYAYAYNYPIGTWSGGTLTMNSRLTLSTVGYVRRHQSYEELISANIAFHFGGKDINHEITMMTNRFDLGNRFTPWDMNTGYRMVFNGNGSITVKKYKNGKDYGTIGSAPSGTLIDGVAYNMEFGAVREAGGVRVILRVDGEDIVNYLDSNDPIRTPGYLMFIDGGPAANIADDKDDIKIVIK